MTLSFFSSGCGKRILGQLFKSAKPKSFLMRSGPVPDIDAALTQQLLDKARLPRSMLTNRGNLTRGGRAKQIQTIVLFLSDSVAL